MRHTYRALDCLRLFKPLMGKTIPGVNTHEKEQDAMWDRTGF